MKVTVHLYEQSQPLHFADAKNTYTKGPFFCVYRKTGTVAKFPVRHIFRVEEDYS